MNRFHNSNPSQERTLSEWFFWVYGSGGKIVERQQNRYRRLLREFRRLFGRSAMQLFSSPGRVELGGNHTDHNAGKVLAASVNLDAVAAATRTNDGRVIVHSEGYSEPFIVDLKHLEPRGEERGTTSAFIRGIAARFRQLGFQTGGFQALIASDVLPGSGLSSSAAIEILLAAILNHFYNQSTIPLATLAMIGQYAENTYFGKPCGLMDQLTCAVGGIITIDFAEPDNPVFQRVNVDFAAHRYHLVVVDTGGSHADLTAEYASVPAEMQAVARYFQKPVLRQISPLQVQQNIPFLRKKVGDRALLRAIHFFQENQRVDAQVRALQRGDVEEFLRLVTASGNSSWKYLQNCYIGKSSMEQGIPLALTLTERFLEEKQIAGACRVHGGGFAGTILAFLPDSHLREYVRMIREVFGNQSVMILMIRPVGVACLAPDKLKG